MTAAIVLAVLFAAVAVWVHVVRVSREQDAAVTRVLDGEWDEWVAQVSDTPVYDALMAETFRRQLDDGRQG